MGQHERHGFYHQYCRQHQIKWRFDDDFQIAFWVYVSVIRLSQSYIYAGDVSEELQRLILETWTCPNFME